MGTQKNRLNDGSFEHPKHMLKLMDKKIYLQFYAQNFCLSKPMGSMEFILCTIKEHMIWASSRENLILLHSNYKGADQHAHPHSLISTLFFVSGNYAAQQKFSTDK